MPTTVSIIIPGSKRDAQIVNASSVRLDLDIQEAKFLKDYLNRYCELHKYPCREKAHLACQIEHKLSLSLKLTKH